MIGQAAPKQEDPGFCVEADSVFPLTHFKLKRKKTKKQDTNENETMENKMLKK